MTLGDTARAVLQAPLRIDNAVERLGRSLWLYLWLVTEANARGVVCRTSTAIAWALGVSQADVTTWLKRLTEAKLVEVLAPAPHVVVKLAMWPGSTAPDSHDTSRDGDSSDALREVVPVVRSVRSVSTHAYEITPGVGGRGEGVDQDLLAQVRAVIGDDPGLDGLFDRFPEPLVRRALARTRSTPADQIKRSRAALFFYLLAKFNNHSPHA